MYTKLQNILNINPEKTYPSQLKNFFGNLFKFKSKELGN